MRIFQWLAIVCGVLTLGAIQFVHAQSLTVEEPQTSTIPEISNPGGMVADYSVTSVGRILTDMQLQWSVETLDNGQQAILANVYGVRVLFLMGTCGEADGAQCTDLRMISAFEGRTLSPVTVLRFNADHAFAFAGLGRENGFFLRRYDFEEQGVTRANIRGGILNFRVYAQQFFEAFRLQFPAISSIGPDPALPPVSLRPGSLPDDPVAQTEQSFGGRHVDNQSDMNGLLDQMLGNDRLINQIPAP